MTELDELAAWLIARCEEQNLSWSEASRKAGVSPNTISEIMAGVRPGIKRLTALASYFGESPEYILRLAGRLPPEPETPLVDVPQLRNFAERISKLPPERQRRIMEAALLLLEIDEGGASVPKEKVLSGPTPTQPDRV